MGLHQPEKCRRSNFFLVVQQIKRISYERSTFLLRLSCVPNVGFRMPFVVRVRSCRYPMSVLDWSYSASQSEMDFRTVPFLPLSWKSRMCPYVHFPLPKIGERVSNTLGQECCIYVFLNRFFWSKHLNLLFTMEKDVSPVSGKWSW